MMVRSSLVVTVALVGCVVKGSGGSSWTSASGPPTSQTSAPAPAAPDPYADVPCPTDLSLGVTRKIDGRTPWDPIRARYAKEHEQPVTADDLLSRDAAIDRVIGVETKTPGVVPAGFRADMTANGRDPQFRLYMARCELGTESTIRRAGHDAALAVLLGATDEQALALVRESIDPDGYASGPCTATADCNAGMTCDKVARMCTSSKSRAAWFLSAPELEIEDALVRGFAAKVTPELLAEIPHVGNDVLWWMLGSRYVRCSGGALCNLDWGAGYLRHIDRRSHAAPPPIAPSECFQYTEHDDLDSCLYNCGAGSFSGQDACEATCYAHCKNTW